MRRNIVPYIVVATLIVTAIAVWCIKENALDMKIVQGQRSESRKEFAPEITMIQLPVAVMEINKTEQAKKVNKIPSKKLAKKVKGTKSEKGKINRDSKGNSIPNLYARYELPTEEYLAYMRSRGARVLVYDKTMNRFVSEITSKNVFLAPSGLDLMSSHSRRITDDYPDGRNVLSNIEKKFGIGNYEILLLLPNEVEIELNENIWMLTESKGINPEDITTVFMTYRGNASSVFVYIEKVSGRFGTKEIKKTFRL